MVITKSKISCKRRTIEWMSRNLERNRRFLASCTRKWNIFSTNRRFVKGMKLKASWLLRKAVLFSILLTKMGHFLGNNDKLCLSCFLDIAHFFEVLIIVQDMSFAHYSRRIENSSLILLSLAIYGQCKKERKENFLSLYISFFERNAQQQVVVLI